MNISNKKIVWAILYVFVKITVPIYSQDLDPALAVMKILDENAKIYKTNTDENVRLLPKFDFIIVGAGTAGCVLANRLSEITDWKVLLIEAGGEENIIMDIPIEAGILQFSSANWNYKTEPSDKYCTGFENKQCLWPRGKVLGGSSVLNFMIYTRGSKDDYDDWEAMGNTGWGWKNLLPYFKKIENFNIQSQFDSKYHSRNGNVHVEYSPFRTEVGKEWVNAAQEFGFKYVDYNGPELSGVSYLQLNLENGTRHSSNRAYLQPVKHRLNLHILTNSLVTRLILDDTTVLGVELEKDNTLYTIFAKKEIIVSAGAINSPQLLMLSGIGPRDHLESMNISVVKNLPVGKNLMDHIATGAFFFEVNSTVISSQSTSNFLNEVYKWIGNRNSPLSLAGGTEALVYMNRKDKFNTTLTPDIELIFIPAGSHSGLQKMFGFTDKTMRETFKSLSNYFMIYPMLLRPKSKGEILLQSRDPKIQPLIIPNYFEHDEDMETILDGIRIAMDISKQPSMAKLGTKIYSVPIEECLKEGDFGTNAYFACQTRQFTFTIYHQSGTCKMGVEDDRTAVVNPRLIVHGFTNLRVIDASVMPKIVSAHTNAPTFMIAEKGADLIKEDWDMI